MKRTYIIGEIGINHNGDLDKAFKLIDLASTAGFDAVKFQKRNPDICVPEEQKTQPKHTPWGDMTYLEYKHKMEFGEKEYQSLDSYCFRKGIDWSASPWDLDSLNFLKKFNVPWIKIPSAMITNEELMKESADWCIRENRGYKYEQGEQGKLCHKRPKQVIISTGMSTEEEIDRAVELLQERLFNASEPPGSHDKNLVIMHCNSSYPATVNELNLSCIQTLRRKYSDANIEIGYSGHEFTLGTTVSSVYLGASYIERHITLDRSDWGSDHAASIGPQGIIGLASGIREIEKAYGDGQLRLYDSEIETRKKLRG